MRVTVLVGGVGGARFLLGVRALLGASAAQDDHEITAVVNVGDDVWLHGLRICPDLDTCMYTLGGGIDTERGWGQSGETWVVKESLAEYGAQPDWFGLGDKDIATHLLRTRMLTGGARLSTITTELCRRWQPGVTLLPATDDPCETYVRVTHPDDGEERAIHFQEWWVRHRAQLPTHSFVQVGAQQATLGPGVAAAVADADVVLLAPSNPVVSIGAMLAVPGLRGALRRTRAPVIGVSPIVGGHALRGMADECLQVVGVDSTAAAVGRYYGSRSDTGLLDGWLVAEGEETDAARGVPGVEVRGVPLLMTDPGVTGEMVRAALALGGIDPQS